MAIASSVSFSHVAVLLLVISFSLSVDTLQGKPVKAVFLIDSTRGFGNDSFSIAKNAIFESIKSLPPGSDINIYAVGETSKLIFDSNNPGTSSWMQIPFQILGDYVSAKTLTEQIEQHTNGDKNGIKAEIVVIVTNGGIEGLNITLMDIIHKKKLIIVRIGDQPLLHASLWEQLAADESHVLQLTESSELEMLGENISNLIDKDSLLVCDTDMYRRPNRQTCSSCLTQGGCVSTTQRQSFPCSHCLYFKQPADFNLEVDNIETDRNATVLVETYSSNDIVAIIVVAVLGGCIIIIIIACACICLKIRRREPAENPGVQEVAELDILLATQPDESNLVTNGGVPRDDDEDVSLNEDDNAIGNEIDISREESTEGEYAIDGLSVDSAEGGGGIDEEARDSGVDTAKGSPLSVTEIRLVTENEHAFGIPMTDLGCERRLPPVTDGFATALANGQDLCV